jgi:hypothetical protein
MPQSWTGELSLPGRGAIFPFNQGLHGYASLRRAPLADFHQPLPGQRKQMLVGKR